MKNFNILVVGNVGKELVAPKQVVNVELFSENIQKEYDRQYYIYLSDRVTKAKNSLASAKKKDDTTKEKIAELERKVALAEKALVDFKEELVVRNGEENYLPLPTKDKVASTYVWAYFSTGGEFALSGFHSLYVLAKDYARTYNDSEEFTPERVKDFKRVKELCKEACSFFNTSENDVYKNFTLPSCSAWIANNVCSFIWGKLSGSKKGKGLTRAYGKEQETARQLILSYLQFLGVPVEEDVKKAPVEDMFTRVA